MDCYKFKGRRGKEIEFPSDKEKWYIYNTKCYYNLERFEECIDVCMDAISNIPKFHLNNDIWIKRRAALSKANLGLNAEALADLLDIEKIKHDWFIQYEIARLHFDLGQYEPALKYCVEAALNRGEIEKKYKLIFLMAEILKYKKENDLAKKHAQLSVAICNKNDWKVPDTYNKLINELNLDLHSNPPLETLLAELNSYWKKIKYGDAPKRSGKIVKVLAHGNSGFIRDDSGNSFYFRMKTIGRQIKHVKEGLKVEFFVVESFDPIKKRKSNEAVSITLIN